MLGKYEYTKQIKQETDDFLDQYKTEIGEIVNELKEDDKNAEDIFEALYQKWDLIDKIHEYLDSGWYGFLREKCFDGLDTELIVCSAILDLSDNLEEDSGLWEDQDPKTSINTQAFFTVRNDLYEKIEEKLKEQIGEMFEGV